MHGRKAGSLTKQGILSPKLQLLSGHTVEQRLGVYRALALADVADAYEAAMRRFPGRCGVNEVVSLRLSCRAILAPSTAVSESFCCACPTIVGGFNVVRRL